MVDKLLILLLLLALCYLEMVINLLILGEGFFQDNVIATYLHGPLLSKNPELADYIIQYCLDRKYEEDIILEPLNDEFENKCREQLLNKFLTTTEEQIGKP